MNKHVIANVHFYMSFLLRIMFVKKSILLVQISFYVLHYKLMYEYLTRKLKAVNISKALNIYIFLYFFYFATPQI